MLSYEEALKCLSNFADELPEEIFKELNGGIVLLNRIKYHESSAESDPLYVIGQYRYEPRGLGRYVQIFYRSFERAWGCLPDGEQRQKLREVLHHELIHHLESLAGAYDLELDDKRRLDEYKDGLEGQNDAT